MPNILVIGGTGFIGHHLLKSVQQKGWEMTSVSLNPPSQERFVHGVCYRHFDIADQTLVKENLSEDFDYVVNLGGYIDHQLFRIGGHGLIKTQFTGLQNILEYLPRSKLKRFVQIGSSDEYGNAPAPQHEELREEPISPYSLSKVASTHLLQMLYRTENFPAVTLRLFLTYGSGQNTNRFLPQIIRGCLNDTKFPTSAGGQIRDFCHVEDTFRAILHALSVPEAEGEVFNIGSGKPISIREIIEKVCSITKGGDPQFGKVPYRIGENMALYAKIEKAKRILQWEPKISLEVGLEKTIEFYGSI